jgi:hypothetical protein
MGATSVTAFDALAPVPEFSVLELAVVICFARRPGIDPAGVVAEISRWFNAGLVESDLAGPLRRLVHREWLLSDGPAFRATEDARVKAEFAARGLVHFLFRDRFFFDVGKLLDVTIVREDLLHDR